MTIANANEDGIAANAAKPPAVNSGADRIARERSTKDACCNAENQKGSHQPAPSAAAKPLRVLIVEDDLTIGPLLAEALEDLGHVVCAVETAAAAAVAAAKRDRPDLMIVDVGLGKASGIAVVSEILKQGFVPHVFVTGDAVRNLPVGPKAILLQKPYRLSDLVAAIAKATGRGNL
jgi:CheY-like chemotaxis protein